MTYELISDETGRIFTYQSDEARCAAENWYNAASKRQIQEFCASRFVNISKNSTTLVDDWADIAMELWSSEHFPIRA